MITIEQSSLGEADPDFRSNENTLSGHVQYQVAQKNLDPFVKGPPMQIIDVQGGSGPDTAWLAGLGHQVMLLESDETQLRHAAERIYQLPPAARARVIPEAGDLQDMQGYAGAFDMALCHEVATYKPDPHEYIRQVTELVKPGGTVSILENGYLGSLNRAHYEKRSTEEIQTLRYNQYSIDNLGKDVYAFKAKELYDILFNSGFEILHWAGVRMLYANASKPINEYTEDELRTFVKRDYLLGNSREYRAQGQMLQFIARKPMPEEKLENIIII